MPSMRVVLCIAALAALGGCVSTPGAETPAWANEAGYPEFRDVPTGGTSATTEAAHWDGMQAELAAAAAAAHANPRANAPQTVEDPNGFLDEARRDLEETRNSHNPY
ncbi:MAG: hypothetical protein R3C25_02100 [Hyphomonadaceae bacterium]